MGKKITTLKARKAQIEETMAAVIERLRDEKKGSFDDAREEGVKAGVQWAKHAHYDDLNYAATRFAPYVETHGADDDDIHFEALTRDELLAEYFREVLAEEPLSLEAYDINNWCLVGRERAWFDGWYETGKDFWQEVSKELN